jgi:hypothetical protein
VDELYIVARRVLLDALDALGTHRDSVTLVGEQAIYVRVGEADLAVAPYTTDGDLALDPARLAEIPPLERALTDAGFRLESPNDVGIWVTDRPAAGKSIEVQVDLLVPSSASPTKGGRAARLTGHGAKVARMRAGSTVCSSTSTSCSSPHWNVATRARSTSASGDDLQEARDGDLDTRGVIVGSLARATSSGRGRGPVP